MKHTSGIWSTRTIQGSRHLELICAGPTGNISFTAYAHGVFIEPCPECECLKKLADDLNLLAWLETVAPETMKTWRETYASQTH